MIPGSRSILHRKNGEGNMNDLNSKKMKKIYIGLFWACILGITGCYEDDSTMATPESMVNEIRNWNTGGIYTAGSSATVRKTVIVPCKSVRKKSFPILWS